MLPNATPCFLSFGFCDHGTRNYAAPRCPRPRFRPAPSSSPCGALNQNDVGLRKASQHVAYLLHQVLVRAHWLGHQVQPQALHRHLRLPARDQPRDWTRLRPKLRPATAELNPRARNRPRCAHAQPLRSGPSARQCHAVSTADADVLPIGTGLYVYVRIIKFI